MRRYRFHCYIDLMASDPSIAETSIAIVLLRAKGNDETVVKMKAYGGPVDLLARQKASKPRKVRIDRDITQLAIKEE